MDAYLKDQLDFTGVKVALLVEKSILVVLRDNKPDIPWPNMWEPPAYTAWKYSAIQDF